MIKLSFQFILCFPAQTTFDEKHVESLEKWIDELSEHLPTLTNFILPVSCLITKKIYDMLYYYSQVGKLHQHYILLGLFVEKQKEGKYNSVILNKRT